MKKFFRQKGFAKSSMSLIFGLVAVVVVIILGFTATGKNNNGFRTVVQYPTGYTFVQIEPDWYMTWFGSETVYNDVITVDFQPGTNPAKPTADLDQLAVRYQDGGKGAIEGVIRYDLPDNEPDMLKIHKEFTSNVGLANKLLVNLTRDMANSTAGLMESEEAYAEKRNDFSSWTRTQIENGKFITKPKQIVVEDVTGKRVTKIVPVIAYGDDGLPLQSPSDLGHYNITVSGFQIVDWDFEPKTLEQISKKREATMGIIIAIADAEKAVQDTITAEEKGKANVMTAKYEQEVEKEKQIVIAERVAEVAVIKAKQLVEVASQKKLEAEQKKFAAVEYKQEQILIGEGESERKRLVIQADGALAQKLSTYEKVNARYAAEFGKQKWVSELQMGTGGENGQRTGGAAVDMIDLLTVKTAKDLQLDMSMKAK